MCWKGEVLECEAVWCAARERGDDDVVFSFSFLFFLIDQDKDMVKPHVRPRTITQILTEY